MIRDQYHGLTNEAGRQLSRQRIYRLRRALQGLCIQCGKLVEKARPQREPEIEAQCTDMIWSRRLAGKVRYKRCMACRQKRWLKQPGSGLPC